jgi:hypothetical protein
MAYVVGSLFKFAMPADDVTGNAAVTVQSGSTADGYGVAYLTDFTDENLVRPALASGDAISVQLAFPSAQPLAAMALWHNADEGLAITVQGSATASWPGTLVGTFDIPAIRADDYFTKVWLALNASYQYWLVTIPTNSVPPGAKLKCYAQLRSLAVDVQWGVLENDHQTRIDLATDFHHHWTYDLNATFRTRVGKLGMSNADAVIWRDWVRATKRTPTILIPDGDQAEWWLIRPGYGPAPASSAQGLVLGTLATTINNPDYTLIDFAADEITAGAPEWS